MPCYKITHKETEEVTFVGDLRIANLDDYDVVEIADERFPEGLEQVGDDGALFIPIQDAQDALWEKVKAKREELEVGTAPTPLNGKRAQIDEKSKAKILGLLEMARLAEEMTAPFSEEFTMADNTVEVLDNQKVRKLALAMGIYVSKVYARARALRAEIYANNMTVEGLADVDVDSGWPT
jgi:hypothetical protein